MQTRDFDRWLGTFRESIATYSYYTDFGKVIANANAIRRQLCLMNSLLGTGDRFEAEFESLARDYPEILQCIPILLASRNKAIPVQTTEAFLVFDFKHPNLDFHHYTEFMRNTGLADLIGRRLVASLVDYVFGVEAGLDSNARKNRGGHLMEDLVETFLKEANLSPQKEVYASALEDAYDLNLSSLSNDGKTEKRFDFVVETGQTVYAIETNFYAASGSKLNETARSYKTLALESRIIPHFRFVWFTDGQGWWNARNNLRETFDVLPDLYCIHDLEQGVAKRIFQ